MEAVKGGLQGRLPSGAHQLVIDFGKGAADVQGPVAAWVFNRDPEIWSSSEWTSDGGEVLDRPL